ncbi:MAG: potassium/proton antiporter [Oscillospiraceae bacterium]|nr:potassium/proton antiporter [Oscillospiraceae bacterium]
MDIVFIFGIILVISALSCKTANKVGLPVLVGFILIGVLIGNFFRFDDMEIVDHICNFALLLIIFTGGFHTDFARAKPVLAVSSAISIGGTVLTAALSGAFAYYVLNLGFYPSILLGVIISSTDVASVFSALQSKRMVLKNDLDSVLELESGSNEPFAHILTIVFIALATGSSNAPLVFIVELGVGIIVGVAFAKLGQFLINRLRVDIDGVYGVLLCGLAFLIFGAAAQLGGSGFLAVYIGGMIMGNGRLVYKGSLSRMYSAVSMLMQIVLFIVLGILFIPSLEKIESVWKVAGTGLLFALFLFLVARPLAMFLIMKLFRRPWREIVFVSWAGFRGASSIVFATHLLTEKLEYSEYVFSIVFFTVILSVTVQSSFIRPIAKKLKLVEE